MKNFFSLKDGDTLTALVCFTDIAGFARTAKSIPSEEMVQLLKSVCSIIARCIGKTNGQVVKYIGDASLLVFPERDIDENVRELLRLKHEIEDYFRSNYPSLSITFSAHLGEITIAQLEPFDTLDILGDTVSTASLLGKIPHRGGFVISHQVFERLDEKTQGEFRQHAPPAVYVAV